MAKTEQATTKSNVASQQQINEWKQQYGEVHAYSIPKDEEDLSANAESFIFYLTPPTKNVIYAMGKAAEAKDFEKANRLAIKNCVIGGDTEELKTNDRAFWAVLDKIGRLREVKGDSIKKL